MTKLNRLGRNLMLVNLAASGAVLIIMAAVALTVVENSISGQQTRDLAMYARSFQTMALTDSQDAETQRGERREAAGRIFQMPERYYVATNDEYFRMIVPSVTVVTAKDIIALEIVARSRLSESDGPTAPGIWPRGLLHQIASLRMSSPFVWKTSNGVTVRVWAMSAEREGGNKITMLMQDMREEMSERVKLRWLFGSLVAFGLGAIALTSWLLSKRSIRPIDKSIKQQSAFVAAASHELRTPVTALRANAEVLRDADLGEFSVYLNSIEEVSERMTRLVGDMIDLARADAGELEMTSAPMDAARVAAEAVRWITPVAQCKRIAIHEELTPASMSGDSDRFRQILLALLDNALRYTGEGGTITVRTSGDKRCVTVSIADNGIGISDEHKPRVFERFYRTDSARAAVSGGAGLGLSIVAQLTEQMRGRVSVSDTPGGGTTVTLEFPAL